ncbi:hypothetical protein [Methylobacterium sp. MA0201]|uniref:hypothetical protein n=1 Tax=Methylobacterium alsaeris TaxID=3344826 RepID=UPI003758485A
MKKESLDTTLLRFQSESDDIRHAPEPRVLRATTFITAAVLMVSIGFAAIARVEQGRNE